MRRFARLPRRFLAVSAAAFLGALGTVAFAGPASATTATITGTPECVPGKPDRVNVTWVVKNADPIAAELSDVDPAVGDIKDGAALTASGTLTGTKEYALSEKRVVLSMKIKWTNKHSDRFRGEVDLRQLDCSSKPVSEAVSNCDGTLTVKIKNTADKPKRFSVNGQGEFVERKNLKVGEEWVVTVPKGHAETVRVKFKDVPKDENENSDEGFENLAKYNWTKPDVCFTVKHESTCDNLTITVDNTGAKDLTAVVKFGDTTDTATIKPGQSDTATIPGASGLVVTLTINDLKPLEVKYEQPANCGGGLPVTGVNAGLLAGAAVVLVGGGGGLFFMARRRRVTFAA